MSLMMSPFVPIFLALISILVHPGADAVVVSINMKSADSLRTRLIRSGKWASHVDKVRQNWEVDAQPTDIDYFDKFYYINISLGVPPQYFIVSLSSSSANFWLIDESCRLTGCTTEPHVRNKYNRTASRTAREDGRTFAIKHGNGLIKGRYVTDFITVPEIFTHQPVDGIMGLAWPGIAAQRDVLPPISNLLNQLDEPILTMWTDRGVIGRTGKSGVVTLGGKDRINLEEFRIGNYRTWRRRSAISDTGTALLAGPHGMVSVIASNVNAQYSLTYDLHTVPCAERSNISDLIFRIGNINYNLPPEAYIRDLGMDNGDCVLGVFGLYSDGYDADWIFGDGFLNHFCTLYDYGEGRMGLAKGKSSNDID